MPISSCFALKMLTTLGDAIGPNDTGSFRLGIQATTLEPGFMSRTYIGAPSVFLGVDQQIAADELQAVAAKTGESTLGFP